MYDYRNELMELLKHTSDDPASLKQTQRSLTMILRLLNRLQPVDDWAVGEGDEDWNHHSRHHHHRDYESRQGSRRFRMRRRHDDHQPAAEEGHRDDHQGQHHRRTQELVDHPGRRCPSRSVANLPRCWTSH